MHHVQIINHLIRRYGYKTYLEIGVANPTLCFDKIIVENKTGVDPELNGWRYDYRMGSNEFFSFLHAGRTQFPPDVKWDCIFIDGLHLAEQVERDIINSLGHLSEGGTIVMHDCSPPSEIIAREEYHPQWPHPGEWCGTTWKAFYKFRHTRPDLAMWCIDDDYGVGIIQRGSNGMAPGDNPYYSFDIMNRNRKEHLNLITPAEFLELFGGDNV
jgi:hypothetical protein